ncbi:MAG: hypothetical protein ACD_19C00079G0049 [uncultured bacterium]|nr:MAG: hypothetical protein ACD_19C00079G0049 [uncultured bacterium]
MCFNCGCGIPDDNMGKSDLKGASLTEVSFEDMAKEWGMTIEETKENVCKLLKKQLEQKIN